MNKYIDIESVRTTRSFQFVETLIWRGFLNDRVVHNRFDGEFQLH